MRIVDLEAITTAPILDYESTAAASASIGHGGGKGHIHWLSFEAGGAIGPHPAGFAQLLIPLVGSGRAAGPDGVRQPISRGRAAFIALGEVHSKGSEGGMKALMIQLSRFAIELP